MSSNTTATERLLEMSNKLWDAMYESGEVPTYGERARYYLALKDAMDENAKLRQQLADVTESMGRVEERCAKLRELVRHMYECMGNIDADGNHECYSCEYENAEDNCDYERLMRELGVIQ